MKTIIKVSESKENPAALIVIKTGISFIDKMIKPKLYLKDLKYTKGKWKLFQGENNTEKIDSKIGDILDDLVLEYENKDKIEYVPDFVGLFLKQ